PIAKHLKKEVDELIEALENFSKGGGRPSELFFLAGSEFADCLMLLLDASNHFGYDADQLITACYNKLEVNKARVWGVPDRDGVVEHIREPKDDISAKGTWSSTESVNNTQALMSKQYIAHIPPAAVLVQEYMDNNDFQNLQPLIDRVYSILKQNMFTTVTIGVNDIVNPDKSKVLTVLRVYLETRGYKVNFINSNLELLALNISIARV
ncbi:MAG: DUF550 domain-containing protein, partial [Clostridium sp.]